MKFLGINSGWDKPPGSSERRGLSDGGAALLIDGKISCATIEERHTRQRYSGGFAASSAVCLKSGHSSWGELDGIALSSCCDMPWSDRDAVIAEVRASAPAAENVDWNKITVSVVDHHESHGILAFVGAAAPRALIAVIDGMGNRLGPSSGPWWHAPFQRQSYYIGEWVGDRVRLELVDQELNGAEDVGLGELYRGITHYAGWNSYQYAGKTMALAAFGEARRFAGLSLVECDGGPMRIRVMNRHDDPKRQIDDALRAQGFDPAPLSDPIAVDRPAGGFCDFVALVQKQIEDAVVTRLASLADRHGVRTICFGGGVAMNCLATGALTSRRPELRLYIPPAPSDTGQSLGNAIWLACSERSPVANDSDARPLRRGISDASLGTSYSQRCVDRAIMPLLDDRRYRIVRNLSTVQLATAVADAVSTGRIVGVREGRSEYGPRALGHASVLAHPGREDTFARVNGFKQREPFRPYAPSVLQGAATEWFSTATDSPFMSFSSGVRKEKQPQIPAVLHADGSARYQTVVGNDGLYPRILRRFATLTGVPILLNTSFNRAGEPIVETPEDAITTFAESSLEALALGDSYIEKRSSNDWK